jgi:hypothetical protein
MGTDASSMKDNAMTSEKILNIHTTEEEKSFNHMNRLIEQRKRIAEHYYYYYYFCFASFF